MAEDDEHDIVATKRAWKKHHGKELPWTGDDVYRDVARETPKKRRSKQ